MLKKSQRLSLRQFEEVLEKGKVSNSPLFLLRFTLGEADTRFSAVAPLKIAKKAVIRNKIRRKIYAALRPLAGKLIHGVHGIIFAKKNVNPVQTEELTSELAELFKKSRLLN